MHTFSKNAKVHVPLAEKQRITEVFGDNITQIPRHLFTQPNDLDTKSANNTKTVHSFKKRSKHKKKIVL